MEKKCRHGYREIIERYCNIIDANAAIIRTDSDRDVFYECMLAAQCEKRYGGCKNAKYGKVNRSELQK